MIKLAKERELLTVVNDQVGSPTFTQDLAEALLNLISVEARGYYHFTNQGGISWFDFACGAIEEAYELGMIDKAHKVTVKPVTTKEFPRPAPRPAYSVLSLEKYQKATGKTPPEWREALKRYLKSL